MLPKNISLALCVVLSCFPLMVLSEEAKNPELPSLQSPGSGDMGSFHIEDDTALYQRLSLERESWYNPFQLTPHRPNYIIPLSFNVSPNEQPFDSLPAEFLENGEGINFDNFEMEFQLSLKVVLAEQLFGRSAFLFGAYTARSFWQAYNSDISSPFRETNYEPEISLLFPSSFEIFGFQNIANGVILNHQSNGQAGPLSRSWNRIIFSTSFQRDNLILSLQPWYRIPESESADDNPDIDDFLGHFTFRSSYKWHDKTFTAILRNNLQSNNRGSIDLSFSYPLTKQLRGYVKYFNGFGMSLIDYNDHGESIGFGILLSDWL